MSAKEIIKGKVDGHNHDGKYANTKREQAAKSELREELANRAEEQNMRRKK